MKLILNLLKKRKGQAARIAGLEDTPSRYNIVTRSLASIVVLAALAAINLAAHGQAVQFQGSQSTLVSGMSMAYAEAMDASGNLYFNDSHGNGVVYKKTRNADGTYTQSVVASGLTYCYGLAVDASGNVYITQAVRDEVLKETPSGGSYTQSVVVSGGLGNPNGIAVDGSGNLYIADNYNSRVIKETLSGGVYTPSTIPALGLLNPVGLALDTNGNIYIADQGNSRVVKETFSGGSYTESTVATGLLYPLGVGVDGEGNVYIPDTGNNRVLKETPSDSGYTQSTLFSDISSPSNVVIDSAENFFVLTSNDLYKIDTAGIDLGSLAVGTSSAAVSLQFLISSEGQFGSLPAVVTDGASGSDFVDAGTGSCTTNGANYDYSAGDTCTINATFTPSYPGQRSGAALFTANGVPIAGAFLYGTGTGPQVAFDPGVKTSSISAQYPAGIATDTSGNVYVVDSSSETIVKYPASGSPVTIASGVAASGIGVDGLGDVYYGLSQQNAIHIIAANTTISTPIATVPYPDNSLVLDGSGNLYVPTRENGTIVKIAQGTWAVSTIATLPERVIGLAIDAAGNLYAAGFESNTVYKIAAGTYAVSTLASGGSLNAPDGLAIDPAGNLYVSNYSGGVVKLAAGTYAQTLLDSGYQALGLALDQSGNLYVGNGSNQNVEKFARTSAALTFPNTSVNATSPSQSIEVSNIGNATLSGSIFGISAHFAQVDGSGTPADCSTSFTIPSGEACNLSLSFTPQSIGTIDGSAILITDSLNVSQNEAKIPLSGTGQQAPPVVTGISPGEGPTAGGTIVTITGTSFNGATAVFFGSSPATSFSVESATTITAASPAEASLAVDIVVTTPSGTSASDGNPIHFIYLNGAALKATQSITSANLTQNNAATPFTPVTGNGGYGSFKYSISPALPSGLTFSTSTGAISGTPGVASGSTTYTVTVADQFTTATNTFTLTVNAAVTASPAIPSASLTQGHAASAFSPVIGGGGTTPLTYSIAPGLPPGLSFSASTGAISGTPSATLAATTYTITVTDANGATASNVFNLSVSPAVTATQSAPSVALTYGSAANLTPVTGSGGTATLAYSVFPSLPAGLSFNVSSGAITGTPAAVSSTATYTVTVTDQNSATATNTFTLSVGKATATVTLGSLSQTYTGSPLSATASTSPASLAVSVTYNGSTTAPTAAGSYTVVATVGDLNYTGTATGTLVISPAVATITLGSLSQTYTGSALSATATTNPAGQNVTITYNGTATAPTAVGSYNVVATIVSGGNYTGTATGTLVISPATATITLGSLSQTYTGSALSATATTNPAGQNVTITYNGSTTAPTAAGSYTVVATIASGGNYTGTSTGTLVISPAIQSITFGSIAAQVVGNTVNLSATSTAGLAVSFASSTPSVCSVSGTTATMLSAGTCTIQASQPGNANYAAASPVSVSFAVNAASSFKLIAQPNSETIHRGQLAAFLLEAQSVNGFSGNVKITCSGGPVDSVCGDFPQTLKLLPNKLALAISGILFPSDTAPGTYTLTFTGTSGSMIVSTTAQFKVED